MNGKKDKHLPKSRFHGRWSRVLTAVTIIMMLLTAIAGCRRTTPPGPDVGSAVIDGAASYTFLRWKEGLSVMLWYDITESVGSSGSGSTEDPIHRQEGYAAAADGRRVEWHLETADGMTATFTIDGQPYDLTQGTLFLISTREDATQIKQLERDLSNVEPTLESCEAFARSDPDVSDFIAAASLPE